MRVELERAAIIMKQSDAKIKSLEDILEKFNKKVIEVICSYNKHRELPFFCEQNLQTA
jgi:hypothetical protein